MSINPTCNIEIKYTADSEKSAKETYYMTWMRSISIFANDRADSVYEVS